ncbi:MAG: hypothetical protein CR982_10385 [Candidatus Cloacimonadota bacterium]|nr:MAG: hypothetical protein CR982_10385 [Candidatus Cloacimonadota bacterium]PIE79094.1 MAG: hypothetical protein CSA15_04270 [Candidatus Delongbacteria bacterium]
MRYTIFILIVFKSLFSSEPWVKFFESDHRELLLESVQMDDNTIISVGYGKNNPDHIYNGILYHLDLDGNIIDEREYGNNYPSRINHISKVGNEEFILGGSTRYNDNRLLDAWIFKIDQNGDILWEKEFGGDGYQFVTAMENREDSTILVGSEFFVGGDPESSKLVIVDKDSGNIVDEKLFQRKVIRSIITTSRGYLLSGYTSNPVYIMSGWVEEVDSNLSTLWSKTFNHFNDTEYMYDIIESDDNSYIMVGSTCEKTTLNNFDHHAIIRKIDNNGNEIWVKTINNSIYNDDIVSIKRVDQDSYIFCGSSGVFVQMSNFDCKNSSDPKGYYGKIDKDGNIYWENLFNYSVDEYDMLNSALVLNNEEGLLFSGRSGGTSLLEGNSNSLLLKTDLNGNYSSINENSLPERSQLSQNYPNPFNPTTAITYFLSHSSKVDISVYDINGSLITKLVDGYKNRGKHLVDFDGSNLPSGVYFYKLIIDGKQISSKKMILLK